MSAFLAFLFQRSPDKSKTRPSIPWPGHPDTTFFVIPTVSRPLSAPLESQEHGEHMDHAEHTITIEHTYILKMCFI